MACMALGQGTRLRRPRLSLRLRCDALRTATGRMEYIAKAKARARESRRVGCVRCRISKGGAPTGLDSSLWILDSGLAASRSAQAEELGGRSWPAPAANAQDIRLDTRGTQAHRHADTSRVTSGIRYLAIGGRYRRRTRRLLSSEMTSCTE
ncbi:hypothetical protein E4U53_001010 [Claviceps sorghi]|nr:hypothetical protein E4U53_001010 [Claviceps sorghi]